MTGSNDFIWEINSIGADIQSIGGFVQNIATEMNARNMKEIDGYYKNALRNNINTLKNLIEDLEGEITCK